MLPCLIQPPHKQLTAVGYAACRSSSFSVHQHQQLQEGLRHAAVAMHCSVLTHSTKSDLTSYCGQHQCASLSWHDCAGSSCTCGRDCIMHPRSCRPCQCAHLPAAPRRLRPVPPSSLRPPALPTVQHVLTALRLCCCPRHTCDTAGHTFHTCHTQARAQTSASCRQSSWRQLSCRRGCQASTLLWTWTTLRLWWQHTCL